MRKIEFEKLKEGDKLYSIIGKGMMTVLRLDENGKVAIYCRDEKGHTFSFFKDGRYLEDDNYPSLYLDHISFGFQERVMEVSDYPNFPEIGTEKRVVFAQKEGKFIAWDCAETIEDAKKTSYTITWKYAREIQQEKKKVVTLELTEDQINSLKQQGVL